MERTTCKQCGFKIVKGGRVSDIWAQKDGYCGEGCRDVHAKIREWTENVVLEASR